MKKTLAILLALVMIMSLATAVSAEDTPAYSITITNSIDGETYNVYKVFNATYTGTNVSYTLVSGKDAAPEGFTVTNGNVSVEGEATELTTEQINAIATYVASDTYVATGTGNGGELTIALTEPGYYYITTTTGAVVTVHTAAPTVEVTDKNSVPSLDKTQTGSTDGTYGDAVLDVAVGDTVYYQTKITIGKGNNLSIKLTDTMSEGLTYDTTTGITVVDNDSTTVSSESYAYEATDTGFTLELKEDYVKANNSGEEYVIVSYQATVNEKAVVDDDDANSNTAKIEYSKQSAQDTVYVATYDVNLMKHFSGVNTASDEYSATFNLKNGTTVLKFKKDDTGYYLSDDDDASADLVVTAEGTINIRGLEPGSYTLEEIATTNGYNLASSQTVTVTTGNTQAVSVEVTNNAGSVLPSTGGIGTTLFYIIGGILVVAAAVVLVTKKRMSAEA